MLSLLLFGAFSVSVERSSHDRSDAVLPSADRSCAHGAAAVIPSRVRACSKLLAAGHEGVLLDVGRRTRARAWQRLLIRPIAALVASYSQARRTRTVAPPPYHGKLSSPSASWTATQRPTVGR